MKNDALTTNYLGIQLDNPIVPSAGPLSRDVSTVRELEDNGAAAIVMYSLFEEQIEHEKRELTHYLDHGGESFAEALSYFPEAEAYHHGPDEYLEHLRNLKEAVDIPVISSLNGISTGGWIEYAAAMEDAGADAIELNVYYIPTDAAADGREVEDRYVDVLRAVRSKVELPVAMKLSPYFSSLAAMARRLDDEGASGLVLFNRFYQPDIDLENLEVYPNLLLSSAQEMRLPLRFIAILYDHVRASLALTTGVESAEDIVKALMVGADVTMVCSTLLRHGPARVGVLLSGLREWMEEHEYESVRQMQGSMSHRSCSDPSAFERANYMRGLNSYRP